MNRLVRSWERYTSRRKYQGPDGVVVEDRKFKMESPEMAERKKPQTEPVLDNSAAKANPKLEKSKVVKELSKEHYNNVIRFAKNASLERVNTLRTVTYNTLKRLQVKRNLKKAVSGIPKGSDHGDVGSLKTWMDSINRNDKKAVRQIVAIDATCVVRSK